MAQISSLWIGKPLSIAHEIAMSSFLYYGHHVKLYVYDMNLKVPPGVIKVDANKIVPDSDIFFHYGKLAAFSDYFRYVMISKTGEMWVDIDTICLSEYFFEDKEYVFIEESAGIYAAGILKMPSNSNLSAFLNKKAAGIRYVGSIAENDIASHSLNWDNWTYIGPKLLTEAVKILSLQKHAQPYVIVSGIDIINENPYELLWNPKNRQRMDDRLSNSLSLTFFNSWLDQRNLDKNITPEGSVMYELAKKFNLLR